MFKAVLSMGVAGLILLHLSSATLAIQRRDILDVAAAKYDGGGGGGGYSSMSSGGYGSSGYGSSGGGGGGGSYGGSGGGGGSYGGSGGGGYGGSSGGGGGYGGSGGGSYGGGGGGYNSVAEVKNGGEGTNPGDGAYETGNVYYYYYPMSAASSPSGSYSSHQSPSGSYYGMMGGGGKDKDKDGESGIISSLINLSIPAVLAAVLGIPLAILILGGLLALGAFFIGRSNGGGAGGLSAIPVIGGLVDLNLVKSVHEAFAAYQALSTDEHCRQRVVCELGYILRSSDKRATVVSVLDAMLPTYLQKHFKPLKEVMASGGESGKCEKYVCNSAAAALKAGPFKTIFGMANKEGTSGGGGTTTAEHPTSNSETSFDQASVNSTDHHANE